MLSRDILAWRLSALASVHPGDVTDDASGDSQKKPRKRPKKETREHTHGDSAGGATGGTPTLIFAGIHGDEPSSAWALAHLLYRHRYRQPNLDLPESPGPISSDVWILPAANPDGLWLGHKNNARDVDLNRNLPASNFEVAHAPDYFPGPRGGSEPETAALVDFISTRNIRRVVSVHAPFACVNYDGPAQTWADKLSAVSGWPTQASIGYPTPGSFGSWFGRDLGRPVITLELPPGPYTPAMARPAQRALDAALDI